VLKMIKVTLWLRFTCVKVPSLKPGQSLNQAHEGWLWACAWFTEIVVVVVMLSDFTVSS